MQAVATATHEFPVTQHPYFVGPSPATFQVVPGEQVL